MSSAEGNQLPMTRHQHWIATQAVHAKLNQFEAMLKDTNVRYEERAQVQRNDLNNQVPDLNEKIETQGNELKATLAIQGQETREMKTALDNILHTLNRQEERRHHSRSSRSHSSRSRAPTPSRHDSNEDPRHHNVDVQVLHQQAQEAEQARLRLVQERQRLEEERLHQEELHAQVQQEQERLRHDQELVRAREQERLRNEQQALEEQERQR